MKSYKILLIGDGGVGKTCSLITYTTKEFPGEYIPTVMDNYEMPTTIDGNTVRLQLWDTAGREDYDRLRPLSYPQTDVFLLCFSLVSLASFQSVAVKYWPEIKHHCPKTPFIIVGLKKDLRSDPKTISMLESKGQTPVTTEMGQRLATQLGAEAYLESSSITKEGIEETYDIALQVACYGHATPTLPPRPEEPELSGNNFPAFPEVREIFLKNLKSGIFSDVEIRGKEMTIRAHKIVLASGSELFFRTLIDGKPGNCFEEDYLPLQQEISEKSSGKIKIPRNRVWLQSSKLLTPGAAAGVVQSEGRYGHSTFVFRGVLHTVGGANADGTYVRNMLRYDMENKIWLSPLKFSEKTEQYYPVNNFHSMVQLVDGTVLVFGGKSNGYSKTLWQYFPEDKKWEIIRYSGNAPAGRYGHAAALNLAKSKMYLFGGYDNETGLSDDLYEYDIATATWKRLPPPPSNVSGEWPLPRYSHYSTCVIDKKGNEKFLVFAGRGSARAVYRDLWVYDIRKGTWAELPVAGEGPGGRYGFAAFVDEGELFVFGGFDGAQIVYQDAWALDFLSSKRKWRKLQVGHFGEEFLERYHHTVNQTPEGIIVIGGRRADHTLCLYVEEGTERGKYIQVSELGSRINTLTLKPECSDNVLQEWIHRIYSGNRESIQGEMATFLNQYNETIQSHHSFQQNTINLAISNGAFSDLQFQLQDGTERGHRLFLNIDPETTAALLHQDPGHPLPYSRVEFFVLKKFLYTGHTDLTTMNVWPTLEISLRAGVGALSLMCEKFILAHQDVWGPVRIVCEGNRVGSKNLEKWAIWFLCVNFHQFKDQLSVLPMEIGKVVMKEQWPGQDYEKDLEKWKEQNSFIKTKKEGEGVCVVQ